MTDPLTLQRMIASATHRLGREAVDALPTDHLVLVRLVDAGTDREDIAIEAKPHREALAELLEHADLTHDLDELRASCEPRVDAVLVAAMDGGSVLVMRFDRMPGLVSGGTA